MENSADIRIAIDEMGWKITASAHGSTCRACGYAAMNGLSLARHGQTTATGRTDSGHWATITRKDSK
jgi:hypothetical protein